MEQIDNKYLQEKGALRTAILIFENAIKTSIKENWEANGSQEEKNDEPSN